MSDDFLMDNLSDLLNSKPKSKSELRKKSASLKDELVKRAQEVENSQKENFEKNSQEKKKTTGSTKKSDSNANTKSDLKVNEKFEDNNDDNTSDDDSNNDDNNRDNKRLTNNNYGFDINSAQYRDNLIDYIEKNMKLGYDTIEILEALIEKGVDYNYASELINLAKIEKNFTGNEPDVKKIESSVKKDNNFYYHLGLSFFLIILIGLFSNANFFILIFSFVPTFLNIYLINYYFDKKHSHYYYSLIYYAVIIAVFGYLFRLSDVFVSRVDISAVVMMNILLTVLFVILEHNNLFFIRDKLKEYTHVDKKNEPKGQKGRIEENVKVLEAKIKKLNDLIKKTYKLAKKDLTVLLINEKNFDFLKEIDYKNIIVKSHNYYNHLEIIEGDIKKLEHSEKDLISDIINLSPNLKRDASGRYSVLSVIMVNNPDFDLKELYDQIFFIIDTLKAEFYKLSIE